MFQNYDIANPQMSRNMSNSPPHKSMNFSSNLNESYSKSPDMIKSDLKSYNMLSKNLHHKSVSQPAQMSIDGVNKLKNMKLNSEETKDAPKYLNRHKRQHI